MISSEKHRKTYGTLPMTTKRIDALKAKHKALTAGYRGRMRAANAAIKAMEKAAAEIMRLEARIAEYTK